MTSLQVLITGGAGFIGTHLVAALAPQADKIVVLDSLLPQVHGSAPRFTPELQAQAVCVHGDVADPAALDKIAADHPGINVIVHLAAFTGTGQSMYDVREYDRSNAGGTAALLESVVQKKWPDLQKIVQASSRAIYGEGAYADPDRPGQLVYPDSRAAAALAAGDWFPHLPGDPRPLEARPTPEDAPARPTSFYGTTKLVQEEYLKVMLAALGIPLTMLRFQNVYGPGQSLKNPYTGVIGVFFSRLVQGQGIEVYEDGEVSRDFVLVDDVVWALCRAATTAATGVYNVGSGQFTTLRQIAATLQDILGVEAPVSCRGTFRIGDIRHAAADLSRSRAALGYQPRFSFDQGMRAYVAWARGQEPMSDSEMNTAVRALAAAGFSSSTREA